MAFAADVSAAMPPALSPPPVFIAGNGGVTAAGGASAAVPTGGTSGGDEPRVRKNFPETLYVNPQLITGSDGKGSRSHSHCLGCVLAHSWGLWRHQGRQTRNEGQ